jgi:hypothetical protein
VSSFHANFVAQHAADFGQQRVGNIQADKTPPSGGEDLPGLPAKLERGNLNIGVGGNADHSAALPLSRRRSWRTSAIRREYLLPKFSRSLFAIGKEFLPFPVVHVALKRLAHELAGGAVLFLGSGLHFGKQAGRHKGIGGTLSFHTSNVALPLEDFKAAMFSMW